MKKHDIWKLLKTKIKSYMFLQINSLYLYIYIYADY